MILDAGWSIPDEPAIICRVVARSGNIHLPGGCRRRGGDATRITFRDLIDNTRICPSCRDARILDGQHPWPSVLADTRTIADAVVVAESRRELLAGYDREPGTLVPSEMAADIIADAGTLVRAARAVANPGPRAPDNLAADAQARIRQVLEAARHGPAAGAVADAVTFAALCGTNPSGYWKLSFGKVPGEHASRANALWGAARKFIDEAGIVDCAADPTRERSDQLHFRSIDAASIPADWTPVEVAGSFDSPLAWARHEWTAATDAVIADIRETLRTACRSDGTFTTMTIPEATPYTRFGERTLLSSTSLRAALAFWTDVPERHDIDPAASLSVTVPSQVAAAFAARETTS